MANDWHASLVPLYLAAKYRPHGVYGNARSVVAIHNLRHQVGARRMGHGWTGEMGVGLEGGKG